MAATLLLWATIAVSVAAVALAIVATLRLRTLTHRVGWFECGLRRLPPADRPVPPEAAGPGATRPAPIRGIAHYAVGRIDWWPRWSVSMRPAISWSRADLTVLVRLPAAPGDAARAGLAVVRLSRQGEDFELTMSDAAYAGLASWLEAAPPGPLGVTA